MALEQRGIATVTIVTQAFVSLAESAASVLGHKELPIVVVGHPVATLPAEAVRAMADKAFPDIVRGLSQPVAVPVSQP